MNEQQIDPLNEDLSTVDTSLPLLSGGLYDLKCVKSEIAPAKSGADLWKLEFVNIAAAVAQDGAQLVPEQCHVFTNCMTQPVGKADWNMVKRNVAAIVQAGNLGSVRLSEIKTWHKSAEGKVFRCKVSVVPPGTTKDGRTFKAKNEIDVFIKP